MQVVFAGKISTSLEISLAVSFPPVILFLILFNILSFIFFELFYYLVFRNGSSGDYKTCSRRTLHLYKTSTEFLPNFNRTDLTWKPLGCN